MALQNTHYYDGQLINRKQELAPKLDQLHRLSAKKKSKLVLRLQHKLEQKLDRIAQIHLDLIINSIGTQSNYDPTNDLNADDLLYLCAFEIVKADNTEFGELFIEQLIDLQTGNCPQGRTHRLFQLLVAFEDK